MNKHDQLIETLRKENQDLQKQLSEMKSSEDMLKKFEFIANSSKDFMTLINRDYVYEAVNFAYCFAHGRDHSEFTNRSVSEVWGNSTFKTVIKEKLDQCFTGKEIRYQEWFEFTALGHRYFDVVYYPYTDNNNVVTHAVVVTRDITDLKIMEDRQRELELELMKEYRLSSIGLLASGIAHNIRTPLTVIMGAASILKEQNGDDEHLHQIIQQVQRIDQILETMMIKCRSEHEVGITHLNLNSLLKTELDFLETDHYFKHKIQKEYIFDDSLPSISGVYSDFSQGLLNIIKNAIDAMFDSDQKKLTVTTQHDRQHISVIISDTGCGIKEENISKLFSPFYTTKSYYGESSQKPKGTGLGLYSSYQILKNYGVNFEIDSTLKKGTTIHVKIPLSKN